MAQPCRSARLSPLPLSLERAASWSCRLLVCAAALVAALAVLRYVSVIVLPVMFALTIAPVLTPVGILLGLSSLGTLAVAGFPLETTELAIAEAQAAGLRIMRIIGDRSCTAACIATHLRITAPNRNWPAAILRGR